MLNKETETSFSKRYRICILSFSNIESDGRVLRQISAASQSYAVDVIGYGEWQPPQPNVRFYSVKPPQTPKLWWRLLRNGFLMAGRVLSPLLMRVYWLQSNHRETRELLLRGEYDLIHANDLAALPVAITAAKQTGAKVLFDAHEYAPGQSKYQGKKKFLYAPYVSHLLKRFAPQADTFVTVAEGIANLYRQHFGLEAQIIMNAPLYVPVEFHPVVGNKIRLIHHGAAKPQRHLETLIRVMETLDANYTLDLMLLGNEAYIQKLKELAAQIAPTRITFKPAVSPEQIIAALKTYDMGLHILPPFPLSHKYALPNKFFEFIVAGLAVAIAPSPEMVRLVKKYEFGLIAKGFEAQDMATALNQLSAEEINSMKQNALKAARTLNADSEMRKLMNMYQTLLADRA